MNKDVLKELLELTPAERLEVADALYDSVASDELSPLTPEQIEDLERRLTEHEKDPSTGRPWEEVRTWLWSRYNK
jgi:putative addiction module component (TIGR02574 family)